MIEEKQWQPLGKKHDWTERRSNIFFTIILQDETGMKLDNFKGNTKEGYKKVLEIIKLKYGMDYN